MATTKKIIGQVPIYRGEYESDKTYHKHNIITMFGSSFISLINDNTYVPCSIVDNSFVLGEGWGLFADASYSYLRENNQIDLTQELFDEMMQAGTLDTTKEYYTYEEE